MLGRSTPHRTCCLSPNHQVWNDGVHQVFAFVAVKYGTQLGMSQPRARLAKIFPRPKVTLSDPSPAGTGVIKGNRSRNSSPAMSRKSSVVSWSGRPCEQLEASSQPSEQSALFGDAEKAVVLDDASGPLELRELAVISTCPAQECDKYA